MMKTLTLTLLLLLLVPSWAEARQYYRFNDENGQVVISSTIPPEFVKKGYEIVDDKGVVLREVEPQLSDEEIRRRRTENQNREASRARDEELIKLYRTPKDVDRAMDNWLNRLDMEIRLKENRIAILRSDYNKLQSRAADQERSGQAVSEELLADMADIQDEIDAYRSQIGEVETRKDEARKRFEIDREHMIDVYERLTGKTWIEPEAE